MPAEHTSDYGLGLRCCYYEISDYDYTLMTVHLVCLIEFPDNPDFTPQPAPAYLVSVQGQKNSLHFFLADEHYIFGIEKPFKDPDEAIKHLKSICV